MPSKEGQLSLACFAIKQGQIPNICQAGKIYGVPERTLRRRVNGTKARRDCIANSRKLTDQEEKDLIKHLLDLDVRGFGLKLYEVAAMANHLLAKREGIPVGFGWPCSFVKRRPELKMMFSRKYDYQRARCEDPMVIAPWFELVRNTISKYGITDQDIYKL